MELELLHTLHIHTLQTELKDLLTSDFNKLTGSFKALRKRLLPVVCKMKDLYITPQLPNTLLYLSPTKVTKPEPQTPSTCTPGDKPRLSSTVKSTGTNSRGNSSSAVKRKLKLTPRQSPCKPLVLPAIKPGLPLATHTKKNSDSDSSLDLDFDPKLEFMDQPDDIDPDLLFNCRCRNIQVDIGAIFRGLCEDDSKDCTE